MKIQHKVSHHVNCMHCNAIAVAVAWVPVGSLEQTSGQSFSLSYGAFPLRGTGSTLLYSTFLCVYQEKVSCSWY